MMHHLEEGTIQAFLDDELPVTDRTRAAEHLLACTQCQEVRDELTRARAAFAEAMAVVDGAAPVVETPAPRHRTRIPGSLVKAAGLVLLVAAAASAAVPGSPVNRWLTAAEEEPAAPEPAVQVETPPAPVAVPPAPSGISLAAAGPVDVAVLRLDGATLRLVETEGDEVVVTAVGGRDPVFRTAAGRIEVRDAAGGEITVELPRSISGRLLVDGAVYAEMADGVLTLRVPADEVNGAHVWP